jgi:hypothetical protein
VGFNFDCWHHYMQTGDLETVRQPYPRLLRFAEYLSGLREEDGLLPVAGIGVPTVWIDHDAYRHQRDKQCAFNLYVSAMLQHALAPLAEAVGNDDRAAWAREMGGDVADAARDAFWSEERGLFVNNLPWLDDEENVSLCDRSLATSILFGQCPDGQTAPAVDALVRCPPEMGLSYPANATWRLWALSRMGRTDIVVREFRDRWAVLPSVLENNTIQESWDAERDRTDQWSHCAVSPVFIPFMDLAGIRPLEPGFARCAVRPQLADLGAVRLTAHTVRGPIIFNAEPQDDGHRVELQLPPGCPGELYLPPDRPPVLKRLTPDHPLGLSRYELPAGKTVVFRV